MWIRRGILSSGKRGAAADRDRVLTTSRGWVGRMKWRGRAAVHAALCLLLSVGSAEDPRRAVDGEGGGEAGSSSNLINDNVQDCPAWMKEESSIYCSLWHESVNSIPYALPWVYENRHLLNDSMMRHCQVPGLAHDRLCCSAEEYTCLVFTERRQRLHEAIMNLSRLACSAKESSRDLFVLAGVPGTGKTSALTTIARRMLVEEGGGEAICVVSADSVKELLAQGHSAGGGVAEGAVDDLSERVKEAMRSSTVKLPLVHSQYLHRESIYLADRIFLDAMSNGRAIILEKTMTTYSQVEAYVGAALGGRCLSQEEHSGECGKPYTVRVLAAWAKLDQCLSANAKRRARGHSITVEQLWSQYETYNQTVTDMILKPPDGVQVWVFNTSHFLEEAEEMGAQGGGIEERLSRVKLMHGPTAGIP